MIEIRNLYLSFTKEYDALHNISLKVESGEKVALVGNEESGRTMLLRVIANLEHFKKGEVYIKGINIKNIDYKSDLSLGFLPKNYVFMARKTVYQNLEYVLKIRNFDNASIHLKILTALQTYGIESIKNFRISDLSNYQKTLVQLARVSIRKVNLFLIDNIAEEFYGEEKKNITQHIKNLIENNSESTFVIALNTEKEAEELGLKVVKMKNGCIEK